MATDLGSETVTVTKSRRTWRINVETPRGQDYVLTAHRELVKQAGEDVISQTRETDVSRALSAVADQTVELSDGLEISPLQIAEALALFIERWDTEDRTPTPAPSPE